MIRVLPVLLMVCMVSASEVDTAALAAHRKNGERMLKDVRAALAVGTPSATAGEDFVALSACLKDADDETVTAIIAAIERLAEEQAVESAGKPKVLAYTGKKAEALAKLELLAKAFAPFAAATAALVLAKDEIENDKPGVLLGDWWNGAALGAARYLGPGGNTMAWFKPPGKKVADTCGLPFVDFCGKDVIGGGDDDNGILLYPDGTARIRFLVWPGGSPGECMVEMQQKAGAERMRAAFATGMNYLGICSGCFLVSENCFGLWPGGQMSRIEPVIKGPPHDIVMPLFHPLSTMLKADRLKQVIFTGGANQMTLGVADTEYIGFFRNGKYEGMEGNPALIAYRAPGWLGGRLVVCPAHPEGTKPEFLVMMGDYAMRHRYALPRHPIEPGKPVAGICGDHQNQYYELLIGENIRTLSAAIYGLTGDCEVAIRFGEPPKPHVWQTKDIPAPMARGKRPDRKTTASSPKPGRYFIQIYGNHDILNGANYTLTVTTEPATP